MHLRNLKSVAYGGFIQKRSRDQDHAPFRWNFITLGMGLDSRSTYLPNLNSAASSIPEILIGFKMFKRVT